MGIPDGNTKWECQTGIIIENNCPDKLSISIVTLMNHDQVGDEMIIVFCCLFTHDEIICN